ncbi:MAG: DUF116 domain-containing protein [Planctomycetota bacterium]|jgi:hypothetical protein
MKIMADGDTETRGVKDRKLGEEWEGWSGDPTECEVAIHEGKGKFLFFAFLLFILVSALAFVTLYMVSPRLSQFNTALPTVGLAVVSGGVGAVFIWFSLFFLTMILERNLLPARGRIGQVISFFGPKVIWLGRFFGISRDRMGSSFVQVCNCLIKVTGFRSGRGDVLILLPRCLSKDVRPKVLAIAERYGCRVETVTGGEAARAAVKKVKPKGIVGVACERDLVSGLSDVVQAFPAVGVANVREEGPCKNTTLDLEAFEEAVQVFISKGS